MVDVHLVLRRGGEVLLARRSGTGYADGLLHAPSGHAEDGEDVRQAMIREAAEELGLRLRPEDLRVALVMQHRAPDPAARPRIGWFFEAAYGAGGEPVNREPDKCSQLDWFPLDGLPDDMVAYCRAGPGRYPRGSPLPAPLAPARRPHRPRPVGRGTRPRPRRAVVAGRAGRRAGPTRLRPRRGAGGVLVEGGPDSAPPRFADVPPLGCERAVAEGCVEGEHRRVRGVVAGEGLGAAGVPGPAQ